MIHQAPLGLCEMAEGGMGRQMPEGKLGGFCNKAGEPTTLS